MGYLKNSLIGVVHTLSIEVAIFSWICSSAALAWGGAACVLSHAVAFSVPSPLLGQTLYKGFNWIVSLNKCGYGNLPIAIYSNLWFVLFLPSKHSSGKAAIFSMGSCAYNLYGQFWPTFMADLRQLKKVTNTYQIWLKMVLFDAAFIEGCVKRKTSKNQRLLAEK